MYIKQRLAALASKGYFPKELPPAFTTRDFGLNLEAILRDWERDHVFKKSLIKLKGKKVKRDSYTYRVRPADIEIISTPKRGFERRNINVTHKIPQALLCYELATNWNSVQKWLARPQESPHF
jgi:hypothetical protein